MLPEKVNICGIPHEVILVEDNLGADLNLGLINYAECKIRINKNAAEAMQKQTLIHEIVHGMLVMLGYAEDSQDETFVQALAMAINQTFEIKDETRQNNKKTVNDDELKEAETEMLRSFMAVGEKYLNGEKRDEM